MRRTARPDPRRRVGFRRSPLRRPPATRPPPSVRRRPSRSLRSSTQAQAGAGADRAGLHHTRTRTSERRCQARSQAAVRRGWGPGTFRGARLRRAGSGPQRRGRCRRPDRRCGRIRSPDDHPAHSSEFPDRPVRDPALPSADLPGMRERVRHPVAGPGGDQPNRDRLRNEPRSLKRGRPGLDAVHAGDLGRVRSRRKRRR